MGGRPGRKRELVKECNCPERTPGWHLHGCPERFANYWFRGELQRRGIAGEEQPK